MKQVTVNFLVDNDNDNMAETLVMAGLNTISWAEDIQQIEVADVQDAPGVEV